MGNNLCNAGLADSLLAAAYPIHIIMTQPARSLQELLESFNQKFIKTIKRKVSDLLKTTCLNECEAGMEKANFTLFKC
jgi:hypothetical protein